MVKTEFLCFYWKFGVYIYFFKYSGCKCFSPFIYANGGEKAWFNVIYLNKISVKNVQRRNFCWYFSLLPIIMIRPWPWNINCFTFSASGVESCQEKARPYSTKAKVTLALLLKAKYKVVKNRISCRLLFFKFFFYYLLE